jgi:hypothetical protein
MVSSSVYGIEELLDRIYTLLTAFGYEVWMSHKGTMPVFSTRSAFENCLTGVEKCDLFLGLITPHYGSGKEKDADALSITHQELLKAIELNKPRWVLAHDHVPLARALFKKLGCKDGDERAKFLYDVGFDTPRKLADLARRQQAVIDDFRVLDMYDAAIRDDIKVYRDRKGNWVQKFGTDEDALLFATAQFARYQEVEEFVKENFSDPEAVRSSLPPANEGAEGQP